MFLGIPFHLGVSGSPYRIRNSQHGLVSPSVSLQNQAKGSSPNKETSTFDGFQTKWLRFCMIGKLQNGWLLAVLVRRPVSGLCWVLVKRLLCVLKALWLLAVLVGRRGEGAFVVAGRGLGVVVGAGQGLLVLICRVIVCDIMMLSTSS